MFYVTATPKAVSGEQAIRLQEAYPLQHLAACEHNLQELEASLQHAHPCGGPRGLLGRFHDTLHNGISELQNVFHDVCLLILFLYASDAVALRTMGTECLANGPRVASIPYLPLMPEPSVRGRAG